MPITAHDFAKPAGSGTDDGHWMFGVDAERIARRLEKLAFDVLTGAVSVKSITVSSRAEANDFTATTIALEISERAKVEA